MPPNAQRAVLIHPERAAAVGTVLLVIAVAGAWFVHLHPGSFEIDRWWASAMTAMRRPSLTFAAEHVFDSLGRFPLSWAVVALAALSLWRAGRRWAIVVLVAAELASWATNSLIKALVDRPRPPGALIEASRSSYPSGHAAFAGVTAVLFVGLLVPAGRRTGPAIIAAGLALMMAWSRTYLLVHWLTDVMGGLCVGAAVGLLALASMGTTADPGTDRLEGSV